jgi:predicted HAD superfamily Cof-like phosphohydrolase
MIEAAQAVVEFNRDLLKIAPRPICPMTQDEYKHIIKAFMEEIRELQEGWAEEDVVAMVDAKIDLIYFAIGGLYKCGLSPDQIAACFFAVHAANMVKAVGKVSRRETGSVPDAVKPDGWPDPKVEITKILGLAGE